MLDILKEFFTSVDISFHRELLANFQRFVLLPSAQGKLYPKRIEQSVQQAFRCFRAQNASLPHVLFLGISDELGFGLGSDEAFSGETLHAVVQCIADLDKSQRLRVQEANMSTFGIQIHLQHDNNAVQSFPWIRLTTLLTDFQNELTHSLTQEVIVHLVQFPPNLSARTVNLHTQVPSLLPLLKDADCPSNLLLTSS